MDNTNETAPVAKTVIRPNLSNYVRDKSGSGKRSHRIDDFTARTLAGKSLETIKEGAPLLGIDASKWEHLNPGQQRMLIGNGIRARLNAKKEEDRLSEQDVENVFGPAAPAYDPEAAAAEAERKAAEKEAKKAEKEAAKQALLEKRQAEAAAKAKAAESGNEPAEKTHRSSGKSKKSK